jgi:hypothetical protein
MLTIFQSPVGIHIIDTLPKGEQFNSHCFWQNVLCGLDANLRPRGFAKQIIVHITDKNTDLLTAKKLIFGWHGILHSDQI